MFWIRAEIVGLGLKLGDSDVFFWIGDDLFMLIVCFLILNGFCWIWGRNFGIWFLVPGPCPPWSLDPWSLASGPSAEISNWIVCNPSYFFIS